MSRLTILHHIEAWRFWLIGRWLSYPKTDVDLNFPPFSLRSPGAMIDWPLKREMEAICLEKEFGPQSGCKKEFHDSKNFEIPAFYGKCGIYGFKSKEIALERAKDDERYRGLILGRVALWGNIIENEGGVYRAKWAYPLSIELGICKNCGNLIPLNRANLFGYFFSWGTLLGYTLVICNHCCSKIRYREIFPPGWHYSIVQQYGISVETSIKGWK